MATTEQQQREEELLKAYYANEARMRAMMLGMKPAATKKTGSYEGPPPFNPPPRKPEESWAEYHTRRKKEDKRKKRPRKGSGGWCFAFPDICYVPGAPPIPIPFPNIGYLKDAIKCALTVKVENKPMVLETSEIPMTKWDDPGTVGGVVSGVNMNKINFLEYSSKVFVEGKAVVYLGCKTAQNNYNALGKFVKPAQMKAFVKP